MSSIDRYIAQAAKAGCPKDQVANFIRANICLFPHQLEASAAARLCDQEGGPTDVLFGGARGPGKSFWSVAQAAADDCQRCPGLKALFLRKVGKAARESFEDLRLRALAGLPHRYRRQAGVIEFPNGSRIFLGHFRHESDIDNYLGLEYDLIIIEESGTISERRHKDINTCLRTSKPDWRPRRYHTTNPGGVAHTYLKNLFVLPWRQGKQEMGRFIPATFRQNPLLNKEYVRELNALTGWKRRAWLDGDWDAVAGMFFSNWDYEKVVIRPRPIPPHWRVWVAMDYGFTHNNAVGVFAMDDDGNRYLAAERLENKRLVEYHAGEIFRMLEEVSVPISQVTRFVAGRDLFSQRSDSAGQTIAEQYEKFGLRFEPADDGRVSGAGELLNLLGDPEAGIPPRFFVFDTCPRSIEAIPAMIHNPNKPEDVLKVDADEDGGGGDDAYDMVRYGLMAARERSWLADPLGLARLVYGG